VSAVESILKAVPARKPGDARYGLIASKRVFKLAVQRNRAKRLIRDWIAFNEHLLSKDLDYVFILQKSILEAKREDGRKHIANALGRILKLYKKHAKQSQ
jgi:ribonuclease P protein component